MTDLKALDPKQWYKMAKKTGPVDLMTGGDIYVEYLENITNLEAVNKIAEYFATSHLCHHPMWKNLMCI